MEENNNFHIEIINNQIRSGNPSSVFIYIILTSYTRFGGLSEVLFLFIQYIDLTEIKSGSVLNLNLVIKISQKKTTVHK